MTDGVKIEHTQTPWVAGAHFAERHGGRTYIPVLRPGNDPVPVAIVHRDVDGYGRGEGEANAAFIVTAVNSHADLIACVQASLNMIDGDGLPPDWDFLRQTLA